MDEPDTVVIRPLTEQELEQEWKVAVEKEDPASKATFKPYAPSTWKDWWESKIMVSNNSGKTVQVSVFCVETITWIHKEDFKFGATSTGVDIATAIEYAKQNTLLQELALDDGGSAKFILEEGKKAYVTIAIASTDKVLCRNKVVACGEKLESPKTAFGP